MLKLKKAMVAPDSIQFTSGMQDLIALTVSGTLSALVFARSASRAGSPGFYSDFISHFTLFEPLFKESSWVYSIWYYFQAAILFGGPRDSTVILNSGFLLLGSLGFLKGVVISQTLRIFGFSRTSSVFVSFLLGTAMAFPTLGMPLHYYLGTLPPNVFHSATQLFTNTIAVLAIVSLTMWFNFRTWSTWSLMVAMGAVSALAKPALTPAWLFVLLFITCISIKDLGFKARAIVPSLVAAIAPITTFLLTFIVTYGTPSERQRRLGFEPFAVWGTYSKSIPSDLLRSWAFPIAVVLIMLVSRNLATEWKFLAPAWIAVFVATLMHTFMAELNPDGTVNLDGNLGWGMIAAAAPLYVVSAISLKQESKKQQLIAWAILGIQSFAGLTHQQNWLWSGSFL